MSFQLRDQTLRIAHQQSVKFHACPPLAPTVRAPKQRRIIYSAGALLSVTTTHPPTHFRNVGIDLTYRTEHTMQMNTLMLSYLWY